MSSQATVAKLNIMLGVNTAGIAQDVNTKAIPILQNFQERVESMGHGEHGAHSIGESLYHGFHQAHISLSAMEGSMMGMGKLALNLSFIGLGIAAAFKAAEYSVEGIKKAFALDPEAMALWKDFQKEWDELLLQVGEFFLPMIKMWLQELTAFVGALRGAFEYLGLRAGHHEDAEVGKKRAEAAAAALKIEQGITKEMETQARLITESINKQNEAWVRMGRQVTEAMRSPSEILNQKVGELNFLANRGLITFETYSRAINKAAEDFAGLGEKAKQYQQASSPQNAAIDRYSTEGFSAVREGQAVWEGIRKAEEAQLAAEKTAEATRQKILSVLQKGGLKVREVTF